MSLTSFEKSREDPADTPDSDLEDPEPPAPPEGEERDLRVTMDHISTRDLKDHGLDGERVALVVKDVYSRFSYIYPAEAKDTESCINSFKDFLKVEDKIGTIYSDNVPELIAAARSLKARLVTSRAYVTENKSVIEREIRIILEGTRANLEQAGTGVNLWPLAAQHHAMALNLTERFDSKSIPWEDRFGEAFDGLMVPFGAKVLYWNNPKQNVTGESKFSATGVDGVFFGYHIQPGINWRKEYLVAPLKGFQQALEASSLQVLRSKQMEIPSGKFVVPLLDDEAINHRRVSTIRTVIITMTQLTVFEDLFNDYPRSSHDEAGQGGGEEPEGEIRNDGMTVRDLFGLNHAR